MSHLFSPVNLRDLVVRNRVVMAPMCIYSAGEDGCATDTHLVYYGARAMGGVGLINFECTSVSPCGRLTCNDLGIWCDAQIPALRRVIQFCQQYGAAVCIQLAHSGRKSWSDTYGAGPEQTIAPSAVPQGPEWTVPRAMTQDDIVETVEEYRQAARRSLDAGANTVQIHAAHGYLIHEFLSPISNRRTDGYGGTRPNRMRFMLEVADAVREVVPAEKPVMARLSVSDWADGGITVEDSIEYARALKAHGVDVIDCSSGGILEDKPPRMGPGYQVPFAEAIRKGANIATIAVGSISAPETAEEILLNGRADMVALGRELLHNPHWALDAAHTLGDEAPWPAIFAAGKSSLGCR
jgi:2,4-dienoyl-CoA reductase-like NADH-dependent reductase (Old Yellow Enzyme family)